MAAVEAAGNQEQIDYWNGETGQKWVEGQERLDALLAHATGALLDAADPRGGEAALDIGCGCGATAIALAKAVGRNGAVVGVDVSAPMLAAAAKRARELGLAWAEFRNADAADVDLGAATFDVAASRFGVMFFIDPVQAFRNARRALKPDGRLAFLCWRDAAENEWVRVPMAAVRPHLPPTPPSDPHAPGPFAFADADRVRAILADSDFTAIDIKPLDMGAVHGATLDEALSFLSEFGPASRLLSAATGAERARALAALRAALGPYAAAGPVTLGHAQWLVTARAS